MPKSVSLLHARAARVSEAHEAAWRAALGYLEREAWVVRRRRGGAVREHAGGFVAAAFRHRTSRAQNPHLHTHLIVANLAKGGDGKWRALDGEAILRTDRLAAGYLYEAHLRGELSRSLGLRFRQPVKGMAELEDVTEEAIRRSPPAGGRSSNTRRRWEHLRVRRRARSGAGDPGAQGARRPAGAAQCVDRAPPTWPAAEHMRSVLSWPPCSRITWRGVELARLPRRQAHPPLIVRRAEALIET